MRHSFSMKTSLWLVLLSGAAWADESADRTAISRAVAALNEFPLSSSDRATVIVSREPWGEAVIQLPGAGSILNLRIVSRHIHFITADVALADCDFASEDGSTTLQTRPILLVMKKQEGDWKIAAIRRLALR